MSHARPGAPIRHGGDPAFYRRSTDSIRLPPREAFISAAASTPAEAYSSTLSHELTHFTAAPRETAAREKWLSDSHPTADGIGSRLTLRGLHDPGRSAARRASLSAQIDELIFHVGTREAFRRAIALQNELNALRPPPRAPDPDAPLSTTYDWLSKRSSRSYVGIAIRQDKDGHYRTGADFLCKGGGALLTDAEGHATAARAREAAIDRLLKLMETFKSSRPDEADEARQMRTEIEHKRVPIP